ncbi:MAG: hypothetical protein L0Z73_06885 [Gammaproteobacteria bacterium]|nr:hypothetical protein [Gammaproteobacteria bacterium]
MGVKKNYRTVACGILTTTGFLNALLSVNTAAFAQEDYSFDMSAYEKNPFEYGGYAELRWEHLRMNKDAAIYQLNFFDQDQPDTNDRFVGTLQLEGKYSKDKFSAYARFNPETYSDDFGDDAEFVTHEAYLSWQARSGMTLDTGKKLLKWGKGYAWNPVGFVERPKDPNEPDLAREGYAILGGDWIISLPGALQTIAITPVYLPVTSDFNQDFGGEDDNFSAKVYFLYKDTDIDVMFLSDGSRTARYGFDFSRNIRTNVEVHGEFAYITGFSRKLLDDQGSLYTQTEDVQSWLLGARYLTESDTTYIIEYYYNGTGFTESQMRVFYQMIEDLPSQPDSDAALQAIHFIAQSGYVTQTVMREYLYVRVTQKEPFDLLYWSPAITAIINLQDQSYNLAPELAYTGVTNLELRVKINFLEGEKYSEFGEKQNDIKLELRGRYFF